MEKNKAMSGYERIFEDGYKAGRASVVLPHPCDGELYKDWLLVEYIAKVLEEAKEVVDAYIDLIKDHKNPEQVKHLAEECIDVQIAATGVMHKLGYGEDERQRVMEKINKSNAKRDGGKRFADSKKELTDSEKESLKEFFRKSNFEIGEIVKIDGGPEAGEIGIMLDPSKMDAHYTVSINGMSTVVPITWVKKVER
jgi:hypothetical protein|nr:MAG TPA: NTP-PPase-like protein [Bacteriophage sp.]